jgi:hypothetical protein
VSFAFAFAPHPTRTGWARDGRPRAPRFVFLFFSSPLPFRVLFLFVSFSVSFHLFSRFFLRLSSVLLIILPLQAPPTFVRPSPSLVVFVCPLFASLGGDKWTFCPTLIRPRSPCSLPTKRVASPAASGLVFSRFSRVRLFSLFSRAHAFPTPFCINGDALSRQKKSKQ